MKTILIFILALVFVSHLHAQTTAIPDTAFEQRLIALGIDSDGIVNGQILNSDAVGITYLDISGANISSLVGIAAFVDVQYLNCGYNNLTSLDVSACAALGSFYCSNNNLTSLDVSANTALLHLDCTNNNLTSLDVSTCTILINLECSGNNLTSLDVSACTVLPRLICGNNNLTSLDLSANTALTYLNCSNNNLTSLDVSAALENLICANNNLTSLDLSTNTALLHLFCPDNNLMSLDLSTCTVLEQLLCHNNNLTSLDLSANTALIILVCHNNNLASLNLIANTALGAFDCQNNLPYLKICVPNFQAAINNTSWYKDASAVYLENCLPLAVEGKVVIDANTNCNVDSLEQGLSGQLVKFERVSDGAISYFTTHDTLGTYYAFLDTGMYAITVIPSNPYWQICPNSQQVTIDTNYNAQTINWAFQPIISCPLLEVDISAPFLRMAGGGSNYTVSYCNNGTIAAANAYVEVDLDEDLNFIGSTIPLVSQNGTVYTFNLGTVAVGQCSDFQINVIVDTSAIFEQTHCTEAHIYPDSICVPIWSGPIVSGNVSCQNDSTFFYIENIGAAMLQFQPFSIIEDNIAMRTGTIQLGAGQSTTIAQAAAVGKTYRIEVQQLAGFPALLGDSSFSAAIEGCKPLPNGSFNTGFITQFSNGHSSPFVAVDCQQNIAAYDPNDKAAQPEGYGLAHYIEKTTALDYKVRFQNTGTDTAFNIVIVDTLSSYLDIASLRMGASSHDYDWLIEDGNVLKVSFLNIMLVDSNANEPLSHGFFRYRIEQKPNNAIGSVINNQAAIYFDYNAPIFTNTTFHTIGENFVTTTVSIDEIYEEQVKVTAFPNPFTESTTIKVEGKEYSKLQLSVFDITGRAAVPAQTSFNNQIQLDRGNLAAGMYIYQLQGDGKLINTGKIIVN